MNLIIYDLLIAYYYSLTRYLSPFTQGIFTTVFDQSSKHSKSVASFGYTTIISQGHKISSHILNFQLLITVYSVAIL
jgi:hypothetical protein